MRTSLKSAITRRNATLGELGYTPEDCEVMQQSFDQSQGAVRFEGVVQSGKATTFKSQRGVTVVELTIVLIVGALLAAAAVFGFQTNQRRNEIKDNTTAIIEISAELQRKFGINNQYGAVTTAIAVQSRSIPQYMRVTGTDTANNSYGGAITAAPVTLTTTNDAIALTWSNVPQSQCVDLVLGAQNMARRIRVAGTAVKATDTAQTVAATLATQCETADRVDIIFDVGRTAST